MYIRAFKVDIIGILVYIHSDSESEWLFGEFFDATGLFGFQLLMKKRELQRRKRNRVAKKRKKTRTRRKKKKSRKMTSKPMVEVKTAKEKFFCWRTWVIGDTERMF